MTTEPTNPQETEIPASQAAEVYERLIDAYSGGGDYGDDDPLPFKRTLDYRLGYSDGYGQAMDYVSANVRNAVFAYELNRRVKSALMKIRWRLERFYYNQIRPRDIPF